MMSSLFSRLQASLTASAGEVVFGMSDGTISILGLVLGVAVGGGSPDAVVLAGATGAIVASVSMTAGCFLEIESVRDEEEQERQERNAAISSNPQQAVAGMISHLSRSGLSAGSLAAIQTDLARNPHVITDLETAITEGRKTSAQRASPVSHATWMFLSALLAGLTPVLPFAFFPADAAWMICITITSALLLLLGIGRARISNRRPSREILETLGIALAAAIAGVVVALLLK